MQNNSGKTNIGLTLSGLGTLLCIVFLVLKLTGVLSISWFWVFFPLWASIALEIIILGIFLLIVWLINK